MRSFTILVLLVGVLALLTTVTQARRHNFKNQRAKLEKFCLANPHHKQCSILHVARPLSDTALRKGTVLPRFFCKALVPACGYFRSPEEKARYMRGLKSQCQTNPRNWKCQYYEKDLNQIQSLSDSQLRMNTRTPGVKRTPSTKFLCSRDPGNPMCQLHPIRPLLLL